MRKQLKQMIKLNVTREEEFRSVAFNTVTIYRAGVFNANYHQ